jgi:hypothetical protein
VLVEISLESLRKATPQRNQDDRFRARTFGIQEEFSVYYHYYYYYLFIFNYFFKTRLCEPSHDEVRIAADVEEIPQANPLARSHSSTIFADRRAATQQGDPTHTEVSPT